MPEAQAEYQRSNIGSLFLHDIVILSRPGANLPMAQVRRAMASVDPNLPIISIRTLKEQVAAQFTQQRLIARLTSFFGILSLVLASIGMYGATAYNAGRRGAIPGPSALWHESVQSHGDVDSHRDAGIIGIGRVVDSSAPGKLDFAAGSVARRVTPFIVG
jgi:hypothetical protein